MTISAADPSSTSYDAVALAGGAEASRDLPVPGRDLAGVHFAMDFLPQQNRRVSAEPIGTNAADSGWRQACRRDRRRRHGLGLHRHLDPPGRAQGHPARDHADAAEAEDKLLTWPNWPLKLRTSSSHEEGAERDFAVTTLAFEGENGVVTGLQMRARRREVQADRGHEFTLKADLVLLAMGFVSPVKEGMLTELGVALDKRGNVDADTKNVMPPPAPRSLPAAICAGANRSLSGRSAKAANARRRSTRPDGLDGLPR